MTLNFRRLILTGALILDIALITGAGYLCFKVKDLKQQNEMLILSSEAAVDIDFKPIATTSKNCEALIKDYTINKDYYGSSAELGADVKLCEDFLVLVRSMHLWSN